MERRIEAIMLCACLVAVVLLSGLSGCANNADQQQSEGLSISDFDAFVELPLIRQGTTYSCGVAALHSILRWASYDLDTNDEVLMKECGTTSEKGTSVQGILDYMNGVDLLEVSWHEGMTAEEVKATIDEGGVVMMPIQAWESSTSSSGETVWFEGEDYVGYWNAGHWVVACGYNEERVLFMDPSTAGTYATMTWDDLELRWHDSTDYVSDDEPFASTDHAGIIVYKIGGEAYDSDAVMPLR